MPEIELDLVRLAATAERLEERMAAVEAKLAAKRLRSEAAGGRVAAVADGNVDLVEVHIDPILLGRDRKALSDLLGGTIEATLRAARRASAKAWDAAGLTFSLPGVLFPTKHPPRYPELGPRLPFVWGFRFESRLFQRPFASESGLVRATVDGELHLMGLELDPRLPLPATSEELERLVRAAVNRALALAKDFGRRRPGDVLDVAMAPP